VTEAKSLGKTYLTRVYDDRMASSRELTICRVGGEKKMSHAHRPGLRVGRAIDRRSCRGEKHLEMFMARIPEGGEGGPLIKTAGRHFPTRSIEGRGKCEIPTKGHSIIVAKKTTCQQTAYNRGKSPKVCVHLGVTTQRSRVRRNG